MQAHQQRVIDERDQLLEKHEKLVSFIHSSEIFETLDVEEQSRLVKQVNVMSEYLIILNERIANFK